MASDDKIQASVHRDQLSAMTDKGKNEQLFSAKQSAELSELERLIGYSFQDSGLLQTAVSHKSLPTAESSYERLEFLGDRVLGLVLSSWLYQHFQTADQGELTKRFHRLSCQDALAEICVRLGLQNYIRHEGGADSLADRPSVQADVTEALIAAIYLDGGLGAAEAFIRRFWPAEQDLPEDFTDNPKSGVQEWAAARSLSLPVYKLIKRSGQDHAPEFLVQLTVDGFVPVTASGTSRKGAERNAAARFLTMLKQEKKL